MWSNLIWYVMNYGMRRGVIICIFCWRITIPIKALQLLAGHLLTITLTKLPTRLYLFLLSFALLSSFASFVQTNAMGTFNILNGEDRRVAGEFTVSLWLWYLWCFVDHCRIYSIKKPRVILLLLLLLAFLFLRSHLFVLRHANHS